MPSDDSPVPDAAAARDRSRAALVLVGLLAALIATAAVPVVSPAGTQSPIASVVPVASDGGSGGAGSSTGGGGAGGLGALSPGRRTDVGGDLGGRSALRSRSASVHFVVRTTQPTYMRTGAYARYTGGGWERVGQSVPYDPPIATRGPDGSEVTYEVRLERTARALPTVWRPERISRSEAVVTAGDAVRARRAVSAGTTYTGVSHRPPDDPELLRTAGTDYPADVVQRYTELPTGTDERLGATTDEITANASTPYGEARAVERWLEANKAYSLNVSEPPSDDVAARFVHEMDAGYCEYFATSMVAMLRTQDIPARYVVGYSTGTKTGERTYAVRGMNAHAWVEVYFPDVGWVAFDPTPADERRQQERRSLERQGVQSATTETPTPTGEGSNASTNATATPTPTGSDGEGDGGSSDGDGGDGEAGAGRGYNVSLNRSATPGATVTVTVERRGQPVSEATVLFNGDSVGRTDSNGTVTGEVPYAERLNVTVVASGAASGTTSALGRPPPDRFYDAAQPQVGATTTYDVPTNATVTVAGDAVTGNVVTVTAVVEDVPVRDAAVSLNGTRVARTDDSGRAEVTLPDDPGTVVLTVERGSVGGNRTLRLPALALRTRPTTPVALPLSTVVVNATLDGALAAGAAVTVDGRRAVTTGVDGTARVTLPLASDASVAVERDGQRRTEVYAGLYRNLAGTVLALAALGAGLFVLIRRRGVTPRRLVPAVRDAAQFLVGAVIAAGTTADDALSRLAARTRIAAAHLRALADGRRSAAESLDALAAWVEARVEELRRSLVPEPTARRAAAADDGETARATVREGWERFLGAVSVRRPRTHTPGELASHAVSVDGLPADDVRTLVAAFRDVEYGQRDPRERTAAVREAVESIERHLERERATESAGDGPSTAEGDRPGDDADDAGAGVSD